MTEEGITVYRETDCRITVEWKIQNFLELPHENEEYLISPNFLLDNANWHIIIYPKGISTDDSNFISIYLNREEGEGDHHIVCSFQIKYADSVLGDREYDHIFNNEEHDWGFEQFINRENILRTFATDGAVTVVCKLSLSNYDRVMSDRVKDSASQTSLNRGVDVLAKNFEDLLLNGPQGDVKLLVGHREFYAHRIILTARSPVFAAMFQHDMAERNNGVIEISDSEPEIFQDFLIFLYSGKLDHVTSSNALGLFKIAEKYDMKELREECARCLFTEISIDSVLDIFHLSVMYNEDEMLEKAANFFAENAGEIIPSPKWDIFMEKNMKIASQLLTQCSKSYKFTKK